MKTARAVEDYSRGSSFIVVAAGELYIYVQLYIRAQHRAEEQVRDSASPSSLVYIYIFFTSRAYVYVVGV